MQSSIAANLSRARLSSGIMMLVLSGCSAPDAAFVQAERATFQAIAPEYLDYVRADPALTDEQRTRRQRTVTTWNLSIAAREHATSAAVAATSQPTEVQP